MNDRRSNPLPRAAGLALLALVAAAWLGLPASAQEEGDQAPEKTGSEPEDGAFLHEPPDEVKVTFSEPLDPSSTLAVFDECGLRIDGRDKTVTLNELRVSIAKQPAGVYVARYTATGIGEVTGTTEGQISFEVHFGPNCAGGEEEGGGHGGHGGEKGDKGGHHQGGDHTKGGKASDGHSVDHETVHGTEDAVTHSEGHQTHTPASDHRHRRTERRAHHRSPHHEEHEEGASPSRPGDRAARDRPIAPQTIVSTSAGAGALALALGAAIALGALGGLYLTKLHPGS